MSAVTLSQQGCPCAQSRPHGDAIKEDTVAGSTPDTEGKGYY